MSIERSCLNFKGPIIIMTVASTVFIPTYKVASRMLYIKLQNNEGSEISASLVIIEVRGT